MIAANHWTRPSEHDFAEYVSLAKSAVQLGRTDPEALCIAAYIIAVPGGEMAEGIAIADRSLAQNPNSAEALAISGILHAYSGDTETALHRLEQANRLSPLHVRVPFRAGGFLIACFVDGDYAGVVDWTTRALQEQPNAAPLLRYQAAALGLLGRLDEARQTVDRLLGLHPRLTVSQCRWHVEVGMKIRSSVVALLRRITRASVWPVFQNERVNLWW